MASDKHLLEILKRALQEEGYGVSRQPWQEHLERHTAVTASESIQATDIIGSLTGNWIVRLDVDTGKSFQDSFGSTEDGIPAHGIFETNRLGLPGHVETEFVPYNHHTNRFGSKGPSFVGHPISFDIVGPTAKAGQSLDIQWRWEAGEEHDRLVIDDYSSVLSDGQVAEDKAPKYGTIKQYFGFSDLPEDGLYLRVLQTGAPALAIPPLEGSSFGRGLSDSQINMWEGRTAALPLSPAAYYEVFRVVEVTDNALVLDSIKRLGDFFTPGFGQAATTIPIIKSVLLFKPFATRLAAVPSGEGKGRERAFAVIPPERAANSDLNLPYYRWLENTEDHSGQIHQHWAGQDVPYSDTPQLPVPRPVGQLTLRLQCLSDRENTPPSNLMVLYGVTDGHPNEAEATSKIDGLKEGQILHIADVEKQSLYLNDQDLFSGKADPSWIKSGDGVGFIGDATTESLYGHFEIVKIVRDLEPAHQIESNSDSYVVVRRVTEVDPSNGRPFYGPVVCDQVLETVTQPTGRVIKQGRILCRATVLDNIQSLHRSHFHDIDAIKSARITNIIDPSWHDSSPKKMLAAMGTRSMQTLDESDKAVFDTASSKGGASGSNADPGSFLDLGFRMVLFPARLNGRNQAVADFNRPIDFRDVTLDKDLNESQYISVDYAEGLITFSHTPKPGPGCTVCPDPRTLAALNNPRGEIVLFASCVPYSMERGQKGIGFRVTSGSLDNASEGKEKNQQQDVFGKRVELAIAATEGRSVAEQVLMSGQKHQDLYLDVLDDDISAHVYIEVDSIDPSAVGKTAWVEIGPVGEAHRVEVVIEDTNALKLLLNLSTAIANNPRWRLYQPNPRGSDSKANLRLVSRKSGSSGNGVEIRLGVEDLSSHVWFALHVWNDDENIYARKFAGGVDGLKSLPETGFFEILHDDHPAMVEKSDNVSPQHYLDSEHGHNIWLHRSALYGYEAKGVWLGADGCYRTVLKGVHGGGEINHPEHSLSFGKGSWKITPRRTALAATEYIGGGEFHLVSTNKDIYWGESPTASRKDRHPTDTTDGKYARTDTLRLKYADLTYNLDGTITVNPTAVEGPAIELRSLGPFGSKNEIARFHLDSETQMWTADSQIWSKPKRRWEGANDVGISVRRGRIFTQFSSSFSKGDFEYKRYLNSGVQASPSSVIEDLLSSTGNLYEILIPSHTSSRYQNFMGWDLQTPSTDELTAVVEGGVLVSKTIDRWGIGVDLPWINRAATGNPPKVPSERGLFKHHRLVLDGGRFYSRDTRLQEALTKMSNLGPANYLNWMSYALGDSVGTQAKDNWNWNYGGPTTDFFDSGDVFDILAHSVGILEDGSNHWLGLHHRRESGVSTNNESVAGDYSEARLSIMGRQASVPPSRPYLESRSLVGGISFSKGDSYVLTVYSADPMNGNGSKWVTVQLVCDRDFVSSDPNEVASFLNENLYHESKTQYVGHALDQAGFCRVDVNTGGYLNEDVFTMQNCVADPEQPGYQPFCERQFLWIGCNDPRHPLHDFTNPANNTGAGAIGKPVVLTTSGKGSSITHYPFLNGGVPATDPSGQWLPGCIYRGQNANDFYNVVLEVGNSSSTSDSVTAKLGGDFVLEDPRCGMFWSAAPHIKTGLRDGQVQNSFERHTIRIEFKNVLEEGDHLSIGHATFVATKDLQAKLPASNADVYYFYIESDPNDQAEVLLKAIESSPWNDALECKIYGSSVPSVKGATGISRVLPVGLMVRLDPLYFHNRLEFAQMVGAAHVEGQPDLSKNQYPLPLRENTHQTRLAIRAHVSDKTPYLDESKYGAGDTVYLWNHNTNFPGHPCQESSPGEAIQRIWNGSSFGAVSAVNNEALGFDRFGTRPLGRLVGSHSIEQINDIEGQGLFSTLVVDCSGKGDASEFTGTQSPFIGTGRYYPSGLTHGRESYLGRWVWGPNRKHQAINHDLPDVAGLSRIVVGYGYSVHGEDGFSSPLSSWIGGHFYRSVTVNTVSTPEDGLFSPVALEISNWGLPIKSADNPIEMGDRVSIDNLKVVYDDGESELLSGVFYVHVVNNSHPTNATFTVFLPTKKPIVSVLFVDPKDPNPSSWRLLTNKGQKGYDAFLVKAVAEGDHVSEPNFIKSHIDAGDLVVGSSPGEKFPTGDRVYNEHETLWEGVIVNPDLYHYNEDCAGDSVKDKFGYTFLCYRGHRYETNDQDDSQWESFWWRGISIGRGFQIQPNDFGGFDHNYVKGTEHYLQNFIPNPVANRGDSLIRAIHHSYPETGTAAPASSFVHVGAGRVSLLSAMGASAPSGLTFSSYGGYHQHRATTYLEHGVFTSTVSPTHGRSRFGWFANARLENSPLNTRNPLDSMSDDTSYEGGHQVGGVSGLRVSGDAQLWMTGCHLLSSGDERSAFVRVNRFAVPKKLTSVWNLQTGPITDLGGGGGAGHMPSGLGAALGDGQYIQEATVQISLTSADLQAFKASVGNSEWPQKWEPSIDGTESGYSGDRLFKLGQFTGGSVQIPVPFLQGRFLKLQRNVYAKSITAGPTIDSPYPNSSQREFKNRPNAGMWRIVGTPMLAPTGAIGHTTFGFGSDAVHGGENVAVEGYGISYGESNTDLARQQGYPLSGAVAVLQLRVERVSKDIQPGHSEAANPESVSQFVPEVMPRNLWQGYSWEIFGDAKGKKLVCVATVVDPGGSPLVAPNSMRGITFNPSSFGQSRTLTADVYPVFSHPSDAASQVGTDVDFLGIHQVLDRRGSVSSKAVMLVPAAIASEKSPLRPAWLSNRQNYCRAVVYSSTMSDRIDDTITSHHTEGAFEKDSSGRVSYVGNPKRLGLGVVLDGGLGLVQANSFRSTPRSVVTDSIGALTVHGGNAAYPFAKNTGASGIGVQMPSTFNTVEFYEDTVIVGPAGSLIFEDSHGAKGLPYNYFKNISARRTYASPALRAALRTTLLNVDTAGALLLAGSSHPNDALFPYSHGGIRFRAPGTVIYERSFRSLDATNSAHPERSGTGKALSKGIPGLEIPAYGECLLLPKGPTTRTLAPSVSFEGNYGSTDQAEIQNVNSTPLYEFTGGYSYGNPSANFPIKPGVMLHGRSNIAGSWANAGAGGHTAHPGNLSQGYRKSLSTQSSFFDHGGVAPLPIEDYRHKVETGSSEQQIRLLDGMIVEDVTNGSFYTVGDVGRGTHRPMVRWIIWPNPSFITQQETPQIGESLQFKQNTVSGAAYDTVVLEAGSDYEIEGGPGSSDINDVIQTIRNLVRAINENSILSRRRIKAVYVPTKDEYKPGTVSTSGAIYIEAPYNELWAMPGNPFALIPGGIGCWIDGTVLQGDFLSGGLGVPDSGVQDRNYPQYDPSQFGPDYLTPTIQSGLGIPGEASVNTGGRREVTGSMVANSGGHASFYLMIGGPHGYYYGMDAKLGYLGAAPTTASVDGAPYMYWQDKNQTRFTYTNVDGVSQTFTFTPTSGVSDPANRKFRVHTEVTPDGSSTSQVDPEGMTKTIMSLIDVINHPKSWELDDDSVPFLGKTEQGGRPQAILIGNQVQESVSINEQNYQGAGPIFKTVPACRNYVIQFRINKPGLDGNRWSFYAQFNNCNVDPATPDDSTSSFNMWNGRVGATWMFPDYGFSLADEYKKFAVPCDQGYPIIEQTFRNGYDPEIIYDLGPHHDPRLDTRHYSNGFAHRQKRPVAGHKFRVTANAEFVPVLGKRGDLGGLLPPVDKNGNTIEGADAIFYDADHMFSVPGYGGAGDVGRFLYISGTNSYNYVGWWVITDVIENYPLTILDSGGDVRVRNVAVLRRWKGHPRDVEGEDLTNIGALPLAPRSPVVSMAADYKTNGMGMAGVGFWKDHPSRLTDRVHLHGEYGLWPAYRDPKEFPAGSNNDHDFWAMTDFRIVITLSDGSAYNFMLPRQQFWEWCVDRDITLNGPALAEFCNDNPLNLNNSLNGRGFIFPDGTVARESWIVWESPANSLYPHGTTVSVSYNLNALTPSQKSWVIGGDACLHINGWSNQTPGSFMSRDDHDEIITYQGGGMTGYSIGQIEVSYGGHGYRVGDTVTVTDPVSGATARGVVVGLDPASIQSDGTGSIQTAKPGNGSGGIYITHVGSKFETDHIVQGNGIQINSDAGQGFNAKAILASYPTPFGKHDGGAQRQCVGFHTCAGSSAMGDMTVGDANNYRFTVFKEIDGSTEVPHNSAAGGLRWVFSAPLMEENVGSYVHLRRSSVYRFGNTLLNVDKANRRVHPFFVWGYNGMWNSWENLNNISDEGDAVYPNFVSNKLGWHSAHYRVPSDSNLERDEVIEKIDIFRINRCPTTMDIILGGDCELFYPELNSSYAGRGVTPVSTGLGSSTRQSPQDPGTGRPILYSPLSVMGAWGESGKNNYYYSERTQWTYDTVQYALQPIARERVVSISPTSMKSNKMLTKTNYSGVGTIVKTEVPRSVWVVDFQDLNLEKFGDFLVGQWPSDAISIKFDALVRSERILDEGLANVTMGLAGDYYSPYGNQTYGSFGSFTDQIVRQDRQGLVPTTLITAGLFTEIGPLLRTGSTAPLHAPDFHNSGPTKQYDDVTPANDVYPAAALAHDFCRWINLSRDTQAFRDAGGFAKVGVMKTGLKSEVAFVEVYGPIHSISLGTKPWTLANDNGAPILQDVSRVSNSISIGRMADDAFYRPFQRSPAKSIGASDPWILMGRESVARTNLSRWWDNSGQLGNSDGWGSWGDYQLPVSSMAQAKYSWSPAGEWWQVQLPKLSLEDYDASCPPPTLRVDLTESFTQAMQPGAGINSPYPGHAPKGSRLNRIWVNFGVWGNELKSNFDLPGYVDPNKALQNEVLGENHIAFNLVVEIPTSQARKIEKPHLMMKWLPAKVHKAFYPDFDSSWVYTADRNGKAAPTVVVNKGTQEQIVFKRNSLAIGQAYDTGTGILNTGGLWVNGQTKTATVRVIDPTGTWLKALQVGDKVRITGLRDISGLVDKQTRNQVSTASPMNAWYNSVEYQPKYSRFNGEWIVKRVTDIDFSFDFDFEWEYDFDTHLLPEGFVYRLGHMDTFIEEEGETGGDSGLELGTITRAVQFDSYVMTTGVKELRISTPGKSNRKYEDGDIIEFYGGGAIRQARGVLFVNKPFHELDTSEPQQYEVHIIDPGHGYTHMPSWRITSERGRGLHSASQAVQTSSLAPMVLGAVDLACRPENWPFVLEELSAALCSSMNNYSPFSTRYTAELAGQDLMIRCRSHNGTGTITGGHGLNDLEWVCSVDSEKRGEADIYARGSDVSEIFFDKQRDWNAESRQAVMRKNLMPYYGDWSSQNNLTASLSASRHPLHSGTNGTFGGRAPNAASSHNSNHGSVKDQRTKHPSGTIVVPLYVNREAGDMMPNIMERFVTVGPNPVDFPSLGSDWILGDHEYGFGAGNKAAPLFGYDPVKVYLNYLYAQLLAAAAQTEPEEPADTGDNSITVDLEDLAGALDIDGQSILVFDPENLPFELIMGGGVEVDQSGTDLTILPLENGFFDFSNFAITLGNLFVDGGGLITLIDPETIGGITVPSPGAELGDPPEIITDPPKTSAEIYGTPCQTEEPNFGMGRYWDLHSFNHFVGNAHTPVLWGGIDFDTEHREGMKGTMYEAPFKLPEYSKCLASVFPRLSRVGGGVRSTFTTGIVPDGSLFSRSITIGTDPMSGHPITESPGPASLSAAAMTGIVVAHGAYAPGPQHPLAGSQLVEPDCDGRMTIRPNSGSSSHAFTIALTPVGDGFDVPHVVSTGERASVTPNGSITGVKLGGSQDFANYGRSLNLPDATVNELRYDPHSVRRNFKVGNWLDGILTRYGIPAPSGSMLPPGARVFLEITTNLGSDIAVDWKAFHTDEVKQNHEQSLVDERERRNSTGVWVAGVKCSFDVETGDGTAYTENVNILGDEG